MFCLTMENQKPMLQVLLVKSYSKVTSLLNFLKCFGCAEDNKKTKTKTCLSSNNQEGFKAGGSLSV